MKSIFDGSLFQIFAGEYEFQCSKCGKAIMQDLHKACNSTNNDRINGPYAFFDNALYGFVCGLPKCNYIQLSEKKLEEHLMNGHNIIRTKELIIEITLLKVGSVFPSIDLSLSKNTSSELIIIFDCKIEK